MIPHGTEKSKEENKKKSKKNIKKTNYISIDIDQIYKKPNEREEKDRHIQYIVYLSRKNNK